MVTKDRYINEDGFSEFALLCGCVSTNVPGFGWMTVKCTECENAEEDEYFAPQRLGKFKDNY